MFHTAFNALIHWNDEVTCNFGDKKIKYVKIQQRLQQFSCVWLFYTRYFFLSLIISEMFRNALSMELNIKAGWKSKVLNSIIKTMPSKKR